MSNPSKGGRYIVGPDGEKELVERTNWTPESAPEAPSAEYESLNTDVEEEGDVFQEEVSAGKG